MSHAPQTAASELGIATRWPLALPAIAVALAAAAPAALYLSRVPGLSELDYQIYFRLLFYNDVSNALAVLGALVLALSLPPLRRLLEAAAAWISHRPVLFCLISFLALGISSRLVYQGFPLAMDEYAPLLQARIFASGAITATYPPELLDRMVVPGFQGMFILVNHETGQAASAYWPGLALLMTPFAWFGGEWLLNPALGALGLWLIGDLARQATKNDQARGWAMLAAVACPQYTVSAISYYAMTGLLAFNLLYLWLLLRPGYRTAFLAGVVGSFALVMHNPVPHALIAAPCIAWLLFQPAQRGRLPALFAGYVPMAGLLCLGWPLLTNWMGMQPPSANPADTDFVSLWASRIQSIFALPNIDILWLRSYAAWKTLIWTAPGLLLIALLLRPRSAIHGLLLAAFVLTFAFYFFFPADQGHGWGYRYIHPAWGLVPIALGICMGSVGQPSLVRLTANAGIVAGLLATPVFLFTTYSTVSFSIALQPSVQDEPGTVIFFNHHPSLYTIDLVRNYPADQGKTIRMLSHGPGEDAKLVKAIAPDALLESSDARGSVWRISPQAAAP